MAFRQSAPPQLSRQYATSSQQTTSHDVLSSPTRGQQSRFEPQLGPISDFGSLNTIPQSEEEEELSDIIEDIADDLDSLDDKLQDFRDTSAYKTSDFHNGAILPAHDGMGSFYPAKAEFGQDSTLEAAIRGTPRLNFSINQTSTLDALQNRPWDEDILERSRHDRIEQWRLEQSKIVLEEIEKQRQRTEAQHSQEDQSSIDKISTQGTEADRQAAEEAGSESIWQQLARHVMRDLIGVNDTVLSAIFGEDLMPEEELSKTPTISAQALRSAAAIESEEKGILGKLIKELRQLAQGLSSDTPVTKEQLAGQLDYAGIPVSWLEDRLAKPASTNPSASAQFKPTLLTSSPLPQPTQPTEILPTEAEYWEQTPNLKTVISYLYRRFRSSVSTTQQDTSTSIPKTQEARHRAAIIQQYHPLTSRTHHSHHHHPRTKKHIRQTSTSQKAGSITSGIPQSWNLKRRGSSCASWSTKRSRRGESNASRNYWDLGESVGSGSLVFAGIGAWGEV